MTTFSLSVNTRHYEVEADSDTPLLWILREHLDLTGTKFGCGKGLCGACTVHLNGEPIRACLTPVSTVKQAQVTTIEGLNGSHPIQKAWLVANVPQCGYCQSGQIMSAVRLLAEKKNPTDADIDAAMAGNLCRCGTYIRIRKAIKLAAQLMAKR